MSPCYCSVSICFCSSVLMCCYWCALLLLGGVDVLCPPLLGADLLFCSSVLICCC
jgi:hypothetical protein